MNRTVVMEKPRRVVLREEEIPQVVGDTFLVKTRLTAISTGTEMTAYTGDFPEGGAWAHFIRYPFRLGYSNLGEVVAIGERVEGVQIGDRIVGYKPHAQWVLYRERDFWRKVPEGVDDEIAAAFALAVIALNGVRRSKVQLGESVVVFGLGPIGLFTAQFARLSGARPVIGVDLFPLRREMARKAGVDVTLDGNDPGLVEKVMMQTKGRMADVVFEVTGNPKAIPFEFQVLRRQGRFVVLSSPRGLIPFDFHDLCNAPSFTIIGAHNNSHPPHETPDNPWTRERNTELFFDLAERDEVKVRELITHRFPFCDAPKVYQLLGERRGETGIVLLDWK